MFRKKENLKGIEDQHWFVVFCESEEIRFPIRPFTRPGFRHCFCIADAKAQALVLNYTNYHCDVRMHHSKSASQLAFEFVAAGAKVLQVRTNKQNGFVLRGLTYCVTLTKTFMGLRGCYALTPFGLYEWLKRSNLEIVDLNNIAENCMGGGKQKGMDPSLLAAQQAQLQQANQQAEQLRQDTISTQEALRRKQLGFASLIKTAGGELGAPKSLIGGGAAAAN